MVIVLVIVTVTVLVIVKNVTAVVEVIVTVKVKFILTVRSWSKAPRNLYCTCLESQAAQNDRSLYPKVAHNPLKAAHSYRPLARYSADAVSELDAETCMPLHAYLFEQALLAAIVPETNVRYSNPARDGKLRICKVLGQGQPGSHKAWGVKAQQMSPLEPPSVPFFKTPHDVSQIVSEFSAGGVGDFGCRLGACMSHGIEALRCEGCQRAGRV